MDGNREEDVVFNEKNVEKLGFVNYITVDQDKICSQTEVWPLNPGIGMEEVEDDKSKEEP